MSDINIRLESSELSNDLVAALKPTSVLVHFGINMVPYAELSINPVANGVSSNTFTQTCDFDKEYRRKQLSIIVSTHIVAGGKNENVCLRFDGVIDGLSFVQSTGSLMPRLVVKNRMQWLTEVAPKIIGLHPSSIDVFQIPPALTWQQAGNNVTSTSNPQISPSNILLQYIPSGVGALYGLDNTKNIIDWFISLLKAAVYSQQTQQLTINEGFMALGSVIKSQDLFKNTGLGTLVLDILNSIDTTAVQNLPIKASSDYVAGLIVDSVVSLRDSIFLNLIRLLSEMGCCLVIGNKKSFVVPEASYLRIPKTGTPALRQISQQANVIFPAEYSSLAFDDNGFVNVKGVYVVHDPNTNNYPILPMNSVDYGVYIDPDPNAKGNIAFMHIPQVASVGYISSALHGGSSLHAAIGNSPSAPVSPILNKQMQPKDFDASIQTYSNKIIESQKYIRAFMDDWAEIMYCKMKYDDRTGSFNAIYNNNWAPGAMGTIYMRLPGIYCDFFVTGVTHHFQLNPPNDGTVSTTVSFRGGRQGPTTNTGIDSLTLYSYSWNEAQVFSNAFLTDISA